MVFIVMHLLQTNLTSLHFGLKLGVAGTVPSFPKFLSLAFCNKLSFGVTNEKWFGAIYYKCLKLSTRFFPSSVCFSKCRFTEFGGAVHQRPVEDLAFAVARFIQKGGSFINYYMVRSCCLALLFTGETSLYFWSFCGTGKLWLLVLVSRGNKFWAYSWWPLHHNQLWLWCSNWWIW